MGDTQISKKRRNLKSEAETVKKVSLFMMIISIPGCVIANNTDSTVASWVSGYLFLAGGLGFIIGRIMEVKSK